MADGLHIRHATTAADVAAVRKLCWDYWDFLLNNSGTDRAITEAFYPRPTYQKLMDRLQIEHARPDGMLLLAELDGMPIGCGMSHKIDPETSEIKRVFVNPVARGKGVARALCQKLLDQARTDGFARVVLDTSAQLTAAQTLYLSMGFVARGPYQKIPDHVLPQMRFYEYDLAKAPA